MRVDNVEARETRAPHAGRHNGPTVGVVRELMPT